MRMGRISNPAMETLMSAGARLKPCLRGFRPSAELSRIALLLILIAAAWAGHASFMTPGNLRTILLAVSTVAVMSVGMTLVMLAGELDLSIGGVAVASGVMGGLLIPAESAPLVIATTLGFGLLLGLINGLLVTKLKVSSLIVTLGMLGIARAIANLLSGGQALYPDDLAGYLWLGRGAVLSVPIPVWLAGLTVFAAIIVTRYSSFGRTLYAVGGNVRAARLSGIKVDRARLVVFMVSGLTAAVASLMQGARLSYIGPAGFSGIELTVIAVATLGGVSLAGGRGSIEGVAIAALIIGVVNNTLNMYGMSSYLQQIVTAAVILIVVLPDSLQRKDRDT